MGMWYNGDAKVQYFSDVVTNEKAKEAAITNTGHMLDP